MAMRADSPERRTRFLGWRRMVATSVTLFAASGAISAPPAAAQADAPAFPGAAGFGAHATGGRGGEVYHVTNLRDSGPGSLREAVSQGPRIVVFDVGGYINLRSALHVASDITIAGQTAPGAGVATRGATVSFSESSNVIVRYLRFRLGNIEEQDDAVSIDQGRRQIFDHVSVSWGTDENFSITDSNGITVQNSIVSEGLDTHSCGGLVESDGVTIYRSLYAHNDTRNPKAKGELQFVNNVIYNWGTDAFIEGDSAGRSSANVVGNYFVKGESSDSDGGPFSRGNKNFHIYAAGNVHDGDVDGQLNGTPTTREDLGDVSIHQRPFPFPAISAESAASAYRNVLRTAGASLRRDEIDRRVLADVREQDGTIIADPSEVGGFGTLPGGPAPVDTDRDGMPDDWERQHELDPNNPDDGALPGADGYTNVEVYLNELARSARG